MESQSRYHDNSESNVNRLWSSKEDFKHGDIICNGIVLGKTTIEDLSQSHYLIELYKPYRYGPNYRKAKILDDNNDIAFDVLIPSNTEDEYNNLKESGEIPEEAVKSFWINPKQTVEIIDMQDGMEQRLLDSIGYFELYDEMTDENFIGFLEQNGYVRSIANYPFDEAEVYISNSTNREGSHVVICVEDNYVTISLLNITKWKDYNTGIIMTKNELL